MTEHVRETPTQHETSSSDEIRVLDWTVDRCREYASKLCPLADEDLPDALRRHGSSLIDSHDEPRLLHYGFECDIPLKADLESRAKVLRRWLTTSVLQVNEALSGKRVEIGDAASRRPLELELVFTVTDAARPGESAVLALYSNHTKDVGNLTNAEIDKVRQELRKTFKSASVVGPMWYWDEDQHGAWAHGHKPFDEAYPNGHPAERW